MVAGECILYHCFRSITDLPDEDELFSMGLRAEFI